jgi:CheY-like chemotaxis protein
VLVVDDDEGMRNMLACCVTALQCDAFCACNASEALALLEQHEFHLALCDIVMPGHDGLWLADQIVTRWPRTAVAFVTGISKQDTRTILRPGVIGYVVKPFQPEQIEALIRLRANAYAGRSGSHTPPRRADSRA